MTGDLDFSFAELPAWVQLWGLFAPDCRLRLSPQAAAAGASGALELKLLRHGGPLPLERAFVSVGALRGSVSVTMGGHDNRAEIGPDCVGSFDLKLWRNSEIVIGAGTSSNYVKIVLADSTVHIGRDCMISDEVLIQSTDQHGLIDAETLRVLNGGARRVVLEDHVWLGRRTTVMPDVKIGFGSVIGTGAVVTKDVPPMSVAVGVPAQVVRSGTTWSRSPDGASMAETALIQAWLAAQGG